MQTWRATNFHPNSNANVKKEDKDTGRAILWSNCIWGFRNYEIFSDRKLSSELQSLLSIGPYRYKRGIFAGTIRSKVLIRNVNGILCQIIIHVRFFRLALFRSRDDWNFPWTFWLVFPPPPLLDTALSILASTELTRRRA